MYYMLKREMYKPIIETMWTISVFACNWFFYEPSPISWVCSRSYVWSNSGWKIHRATRDWAKQKYVGDLIWSIITKTEGYLLNNPHVKINNEQTFREHTRLIYVIHGTGIFCAQEPKSTTETARECLEEEKIPAGRNRLTL